MWRALSDGATLDRNSLAGHWLTLLAGWIEGTRNAALILLDDGNDPPQLGAVWPAGVTPPSDLAALAELVLRNSQPTLRPGHAGHGLVLAYPYQRAGRLKAVVALNLPTRLERDGRALLRNLRWAGGWLEAAVLSSSPDASVPGRATATPHFMSLAVDVLAADGFAAACRSLATGLCPVIGADRIAVIWFHGNKPRLVALSHTADVNSRLSFAGLVADAAAEAADQRAVLVFSSTQVDAMANRENEGAVAYVMRAQAAYAMQAQRQSVLSVPLMFSGQVVGALVADATAVSAFDADAVLRAEAAGAMLTPALMDKRRIGQGVPGALRSSTGKLLSGLFGHDRVKLKLTALAALVLLVSIIFVTAPYQIVATARIEGAEMRWLVAPFDGYIAETSVRPGETVAKGTVVATLATDDLRLERLAQLAELRRREIAFAAAQAEADRGQMNILRAEMDRDRANLALLEASIARAALVAPFDAVVVEGDLRDRLGAPVSRGDQLLGLAPQGALRVTLLVRDADIDDLHIGQTGTLRLAAVPGASMGLRVLSLTPVTEIEDGRNVFRAEAEVMDGLRPAANTAAVAVGELRPGMAGVARLDVDRRRVVEIWTKDVIDWLRLRLWGWLP